MEIRGRTAFAMVVFVASIFVLGMKLLTPTPIQIFIGGSQTAVRQIPGFFTLADTVVIAVSSCLLGVSTMYLLFSDSFSAVKLDQVRLPEEIVKVRKEKWAETAKMLKNDEQAIYQVVLDADGIILQSEIVERTGFPKAKVSRCLDAMENKDLVERRRRGMSNIVLLK